MIIFGFGKVTTKHCGKVNVVHCQNCHNEKEWELRVIKRWFTLYFIPIFPYQIIRVISCPVCGASKEVDKQTFNALRMRVVINDSYSNYESDDTPVVRKTPTQLNYLREMEQLKKEMEEKQS